MSYISQRGATGGLALTANGIFQQYAPQSGLPAGYTDNTFLEQLGTRWDLDDGREVVLVLAGASNLAEGKLMQDAALISAHANLAVTAVQAYSNNGNTPATVTVTLGAAAATVNQYAGGYAAVVDGTGAGQTLQIASNPAAASSGSLTVTLADGPNTALDTTSKITLIPQPASNVIIYPHGAMTNAVRGVTLYPITSGNYGFLLSKGTVSVLADATAPTAAEPVGPSTTVDGAIGTIVATTATALPGYPVGYAIANTVSAKYYPVEIDL